MTDDSQLPRTADEARKAGYKKFEELEPALQRKIEAFDRTQQHTFALTGNPCAGGNTGACSTTDYPDGTQKICYCSASEQCDDCHFQPGG